MSDRLLAVFIIALGAAYIYGTKFIRVVSGGHADPLGPRVFPVLIGIIAISAGVMLILESIRKQRSGENDEPSSAAPSQPVAVTALFAWMLLYYLTFEPVGYLLSTPVFLFGVMAFFNRGKWLANALSAVLFPLVIYTGFTQLLGKHLGEGLIYF